MRATKGIFDELTRNLANSAVDQFRCEIKVLEDARRFGRMATLGDHLSELSSLSDLNNTTSRLMKGMNQEVDRLAEATKLQFSASAITEASRATQIAAMASTTSIADALGADFHTASRSTLLGISDHLHQVDQSLVLGKLIDAANSPIRSAMRDFGESLASRELKRAKELSQSPMLEALRSFDLQASLSMRQLSELPGLKLAESLRDASAFAGIASFIDLAYPNLDWDGLVSAREMFGNDLDYELDQDGAALPSERLIANITEWIASVPVDILSAKALIQFFVYFILPLILAQISQDALENRQKERMDDLSAQSVQNDSHAETRHRQLLQLLEDKMEEQLEALQSQEPPTLLTVTERVRLRSGPGLDFEVIGVIPSNFYVVELRREGEWVEVEYIDLEETTRQRGWASADYLAER